MLVLEEWLHFSKSAYCHSSCQIQIANSDKKQKVSSHILKKNLFFSLPMHSLSIIYIRVYIFMQLHNCSRSIWFHAHRGYWQGANVPNQTAWWCFFSLLLLLYFLKASEDMKQMNSFFHLLHWGSLNWLPMPVLLWSNMGISHNF